MQASRVVTPDPLGASPLRGRVIAFVHQSADLYGSDRVLLDAVDVVSGAGADVVVLVPCDGPLVQVLRQRGVETHVVAVAKLSKSTLSVGGAWRLLREAFAVPAAFDRLLRQRRVDLVYSNTLATLGGAIWSSLRRVPHVWHVHEILQRPRGAAGVFRWLLDRFADSVVCNSPATANWLLAAHRAGLAAKTSVVPNALAVAPDVVPAAVASARSLMVVDDAPFVIGLVGRIGRAKGHLLLVEAVEILAARGVRNFSVAIVGDPPTGQEHLERDLRARIDRSDAGHRFRLLGFIATIGPVYRALDLLCVPSTEPESFGLVALEAMAAGTAVIASRNHGLGWLVNDDHTGLLFETGDANALADCIDALLKDEARRLAIGEAGRAFVEREFGQAGFRTAICRLVAETITAYAMPSPQGGRSE